MKRVYVKKDSWVWDGLGRKKGVGRLGRNERDPKKRRGKWYSERKIYTERKGVSTSQRDGQALAASLASVVVNAHVEAGRVDTLEVPVEDVLEIIEVVMLRADGIVVSECDGETKVPAIIISHGGSEVSIVLIENGLEVACTDANVDLGIIAVWSVRGALVRCDLHHSDLGRTTGHRGVATGFLEGDGGEEDGGDTGFGREAFEDVEVRCARGKGVVVLLEDGGEILVHEVLECDWGWHPAVTVDTAVEPVLVAVGSAGGSRVGNAIGVTALASSGNNDCTARAWGSIWARGCRFFRASASGLLGTGGSGLWRRITASRLGHGDSGVFGDGGRSSSAITSGGSLFLARVRSHGGVLGDGTCASTMTSREMHFAADTTAVRAGWEDFEVLIVGRSGRGRETGCDEGKSDRCKSGEMHCF
jgi:hypothetical protein